VALGFLARGQARGIRNTQAGFPPGSAFLGHSISRNILERLFHVAVRSRGIFSTRSLMMLRWISSEPPAIELG